MSQEWKYDESSGSFRPSQSGESHSQYTRAGNAPRVVKKEEGGWGGWALIAAMFLFGIWPIGLILLISKLKDENKPKRTRDYTVTSRAGAQASTVERSSGVRKTTQTTATRETGRVTDAAKKITRSPKESGGTSKALTIIGSIMAAFGTVGLSTELGALLSAGTLDWSGLFYAIGLIAGGGVMIGKGLSMRRRRNRIAGYRAVMGERDFVTVDELCAVTGRRRRTVERDIEHMLQKNLLDTGAFYDAGHGILFRSADAYQRYLRERTEKEDLTPKEAQEGYSGALRAIRAANDQIPDPVFSEKLDRMEELAGKIFREVEQHPEKQKQASQFFDYYLPTTLKLLSTYTEFEEAGIEGENLRQAKGRIESIMDTLLQNFERQLDELYRSEAMDIDADIRVMETMLKRDLSSVESDFGLSGGSAVQSKPE